MPVLVAPPDSSEASRNYTNHSAYLNNLALIYHREGTSTPLPPRPVRSDVGNNPWEVRPESGDVFSQGSFSGGMGQTFFHRPTRDEAKYLWSRGMEIIKESLELGNPWSESHATQGFTQFAVHENDLFGVVVNDTSIYTTTDLATWTTETVDATDGALDVTSGGTNLYVGTVGGVRVRDSGGTWSDEVDYASQVSRILFTKGRLILDNNGTLKEHIPGGASTTIETFPSGWQTQDIWSNGTFIYVALLDGGGNRSEIRHYGLNDAGTAIEAKGSTEMPPGTEIRVGLSTVGITLLAGRTLDDTDQSRCVLFQATPNDSGALVYAKVAEGRASSGVAAKVTSMIAVEESVYMNWDTGNLDELSGVGRQVACYNLATGAFTLLPTYSSTLANQDTGITRFIGEIVIGSSDLNKTFNQDTANKTTTGTLITSIADWNNAGQKAWDIVEWTTTPLPAGASVKLYYSTRHPEDDDWTLIGTQDGNNTEGARFTLADVTSRILALKVELNRATDTTLGPEFLNFSVRSHPTSTDPEWRRTIYPRWMHGDRKTKGGKQEWWEPRTKAAEVKDLLNDAVTLYEPAETWTARVVQVNEIHPDAPVYNETTGEPEKDVLYMEVMVEGTRIAT